MKFLIAISICYQTNETFDRDIYLCYNLCKRLHTRPKQSAA